MANNGFGTGVVFTTLGINASFVTGSVVAFTLDKQGSIKEAFDGSDNFLGAYVSKQRKVATIKVIFQSSGSAMVIPELLASCTATNPSSGDCAGNWAVYKSQADWKSDDYLQGTFEIQQLTKTSGTLP